MRVCIHLRNEQNEVAAETLEALEPQLLASVKRTLEREFHQADVSGLDTETLELDLSYVSPADIQAANRSYRQKDRVTDVLSFPMLNMQNGKLLEALGSYDYNYENIELADSTEDDGKILSAELMMDQGPRRALAPSLPLGEILLCPAVAQEQAESSQHSLLREICYLLVHSCLHLLGFDHETEGEDVQMRGLARAIMQDVGLALAGDAKTEAEMASSTASHLEQLSAAQPERLGTVIQRSGFVAIVGRPNVGKSTLLNTLVDSRLAITTAKAQTTRHNIRGIRQYQDAQFVFVDTPGLHPVKHRLDELMNQRALHAAEEADLVLLMVEAERDRLRPEEEQILEQLQALQKPLFLLLNKIDRRAREKLLPVMAALSERYPSLELLPVSALTGDGIEEALKAIYPYMPKGQALYEAESFTDQTERQLAAEYIREQILLQMREEIPHGVGVAIVKFEELDQDGRSVYESGKERVRVRIEADLVCDKTQHKGMLLGREGRQIRAISQAAREQIEAMLDCPCYLRCFVKVRPNWRNQAHFLKEYELGAAQER